MKLATALSRRSEMQNHLSELDERLQTNSKVQEGQLPAEDPMNLLEDLDRTSSELETLIRQINRTNALSMKDGQSIADRLARRDVLSKRLSILRRFLDSASAKVDRYSRSEIVVNSTVDVPEFRKEVDQLSKELRLLDESIQEMNWTIDLMED